MKRVYQATIFNNLEHITKGIPHILGKNYFDRISGKQSVSDAEYAKVLEKFENYVASIGDIAFIYAFTLDGDRVVEVADTPSPAEKLEKSPFFSEYRSATPQIRKMLHNPNIEPQISYESDEYGEFVSYLMVYKNSHGRAFVLGTDLEIHKFHRGMLELLGFSFILSSAAIASYLWIIYRYRNTFLGICLRSIPFLFVVVALFWRSDYYLIQGLEKQLYIAGKTILEILGQEYIDRAQNVKSITPTEYKYNRKILYEYTNSVGLLYTYALRKEGEAAYFIAAADPPDEKGAYEGYWAIYDTAPPSLFPLFKKIERKTIAYTDEYGAVYSTFFSILDKHNNFVVVGADQGQTVVLEKKQQLFWQSFSVAMFCTIVLVTAWEYIRKKIGKDSGETQTLILQNTVPTFIPEQLPWKIAGVTSGVMILLLSIFYVFSQRVLYQSYSQLEHQDITDQLKELSNSFTFEMDRHNTYLSNWLADGNTYRFVRDRDAWFKKMEFIPEILNRLEVNLLMYLDKDFHITTTIESTPGLSQEILDYLKENPDHLTFAGSSKELRNELIYSKGQLYILGIAPLFPSSTSKKSEGVLITAKIIDGRFVDKLAKRQNLSVRFYGIEDAYKVAQFQPILQKILETGENQIVPENDTYIYGYSLIRDSKDQPLVFVRLLSERSVLGKGKQLINRTLLYGLLTFGLIIIATNLYLLQRLVLKRLSQLVSNIQSLRHPGNLEKRLTVEGKDEISYLIYTFNQLLENIATERANLDIEREKAERLLHNILPKSIAERLKQHLSLFSENGYGIPIAEQYENVAVLFADIVGFTAIANSSTPEEVVNLLNRIFSIFDQLTELYHLEKIKTIGDAYMVVGGLPEAMPNSVTAVAAMAIDMQKAIAEFRAHQGNSLSIRVGIHVGVVIAGTIGKKKFAYDLWGDTVNIASRMESQGEPNKIQVSEDVYQCLKEKYSFEERGEIIIKGIGHMKTYWLLEKHWGDSLVGGIL